MKSHWQPKKIIEDIQISFVYPPIPDRNFDWCATRKGWEPGDPAGQGRTPVVALADLLEREMEREDDRVLAVGEPCAGSYEGGLFWCSRCKAKHPKDCITETAHNLTHGGI